LADLSHALDDPSFVTRLDPGGMLGYTERFPGQVREAVEIGFQAEIPTLEMRPGVAVLTGLGGSAAGGDFVRSLFEASGAVPFLVNRDYHVPHHLGLGDLVFCSSYSGNTEETLSAYADARTRGCRLMAVTSGGRLAEDAARDGVPVARVPGGQPPRTALGYMTMPVMVACERLKLIPPQPYEKAAQVLDGCGERWGVSMPTERNEAKQVALALHGKLAVIYGLGSWQGALANRWKGQINENAKNLAFCNALPEMNHNEILGWTGASEQGVAGWVVVTLEDGSESAKMKARARVSRELIGSQAQFVSARAVGDSHLERMLSLAYMADFVSLYLAALNAVDPEKIDAIDKLKSALSGVA